MMLAGGEFEGKRILSEAAVKEMTRKQTSPAIKEGYGLGWSVSGSTFGHGGAYGPTNMSVDRERGLVLIIMVQRVRLPREWRKEQGCFHPCRFGTVMARRNHKEQRSVT